MAQALLLKAGGGGLKSNKVTAAKVNVMAGFTALTSDSENKAAEGTLPLSAVTVAYGGTIATYDGTVQ